YYEDAGTAAQAAWITPPDGGAFDAGVSWQAAAVPENTHVRWRARAFDGNATNGYSPWSNFFNFVVSTVNDPPTAPVITKPADGRLDDHDVDLDPGPGAGPAVLRARLGPRPRGRAEPVQQRGELHGQGRRAADCGGARLAVRGQVRRSAPRRATADDLGYA